MTARTDHETFKKVLRLIMRIAIRKRQRRRKGGTQSDSGRKIIELSAAGVPERKVTDELDLTPGYVRRQS